ncbi:hypothetical protein QPX10_10540 [Corynebacterium pseudodiphtheriticum]|uniref:hypothetical protein n=1 Tax=Corynebacterium TaxID=1716 RepID=UPI002541AE74|nr:MULTISPECIES: hypothetical protein [Corynebacterium]MDK4244103.1 hypothetical protein [Corynebacterium pseudodiphtheriticum]MDK4258479.1 hypothetical protein [Corynebacterium propinquum]
MSLLDAQKWLDQRSANDPIPYGIMVQLDGDGEYQMIWIDMGRLEATNQIALAEWIDRDVARDIAKRSIGDLCRFKGEEREIARAFIVEKGTNYRVIEEVTSDAPEPYRPTRSQMEETMTGQNTIGLILTALAAMLAAIIITKK